MWKIVIVDDDFQVVRGLRKAIPWAELDAEFAGEAIDGEAGLKLIEEVNPDIVLTDIYMPFMNGMQMIEELKRRNFAGRFIVLSGYNDFEYARTAIRLGVDDYLSKPITIDQIRDVLSSTIEKLEETYLKRFQSTRDASANPSENAKKTQWLASVLNGWEPDQSRESLPFPGEQGGYAVMVIEVLWSGRISRISLADWNLFKFAVSNIVGEVLAEEWPEASFSWVFGNRSALLLPAGDSRGRSGLSAQAEELGILIANRLNEFLRIQIRYACGEAVSSREGIKASADEAMQKLLESQEFFVREEASGAVSADMGPASGDEFSLSDYSQAMKRALEAGDDDEASKLIRLFLDRRQPEGPGDLAGDQAAAAELWTLLHNSMVITGASSDKSGEEVLALRELDGVADRSRIEAWLLAQIKALKKADKPLIQEKHRKAVQFMIEYIHEHYAEDITLDKMASQLYISKNYLNQLFKKVTGETLTNYVIRVRIEKAKTLLKDGNHLIYEVSEMVGYQNVPYFSTLFKKYCGVSPSDMIKR